MIPFYTYHKNLSLLEGVGHSGMGAYHGKYGFDTFTHHKSVFIQSRFSLTPMLTRTPISGFVKKLLRFLS